MSWESARKRARQQERLVERKIEELRAVNSSLTVSGGGYDPEAANYPKEAGLMNEIENLFTSLCACVDDMTNVASGERSKQQQIRRYRQVIQENRTEYQRIARSLKEKRESAALFGDMNSEFNGKNSEVDHLLRERRGLESGLRSADLLLDQADATKAELLGQRSIFESTGRRLMGPILNAFPVLNTWIEKVKKRKQRDQIVLAAVIETLVLFLLWWIRR